jgi:DNA-directed RNA polymerase subunit omega
MARITVEDCVKRIDRFRLVIVAAERARQIEGGSVSKLPRENDKVPVVALREVAQGLLDFDALQSSFVRTFTKHKSDDDLSEKGLDEDTIFPDSDLLEDGYCASEGDELKAIEEDGMDDDQTEEVTLSQDQDASEL